MPFSGGPAMVSMMIFLLGGGCGCRAAGVDVEVDGLGVGLMVDVLSRGRFCGRTDGRGSFFTTGMGVLLAGAVIGVCIGLGICVGAVTGATLPGALVAVGADAAAALAVAATRPGADAATAGGGAEAELAADGGVVPIVAGVDVGAAMDAEPAAVDADSIRLASLVPRCLVDGGGGGHQDAFARPRGPMMLRRKKRAESNKEEKRSHESGEGRGRG
ncbi:hypothetical protein V8E36_005273 [Tilletia maclaganii]